MNIGNPISNHGISYKPCFACDKSDALKSLQSLFDDNCDKNARAFLNELNIRLSIGETISRAQINQLKRYLNNVSDPELRSQIESMIKAYSNN